MKKVISIAQVEEIIRRHWDGEMLIDILKNMRVKEESLRRLFKNYEN